MKQDGMVRVLEPRKTELWATGKKKGSIQALWGNFEEFIKEVRTDLYVIREHIVAVLKTLGPNEEQLSAGWEFGLKNRDNDHFFSLFFPKDGWPQCRIKKDI